jgi:hypothetical protein
MGIDKTEWLVWIGFIWLGYIPMMGSGEQMNMAMISQVPSREFF